jgi:malyl-CoA/(S)-citramalyl-CoA lyase
MIHFVPPAQSRRSPRRCQSSFARSTWCSVIIEDAIPADAKEAARKGFIAMAAATEFGATGLWTRINALKSPWALDDITDIVARRSATSSNVIMLPKVEGAWDIHYLDQLLAQLEARHAIKRPILIHAILETARRQQRRAIASASPRMHGMSLGPADLAASRGMKTTRVGGGHPDYVVLADGKAGDTRQKFQQDLWHYTTAKMVGRLHGRRHQAVLRPVRRLLRP